MKQVEQAPCPSWYADNEWNVGISGIYAANVNGDGDFRNYFQNDDPWNDGFGGAIDVKYFFRRYFGFGVQGAGLQVQTNNDVPRILPLSPGSGRFGDSGDDKSAWSVLGTFTVRYPIPCSRFAPFAWVGAGAYFHDSHDNSVIGNVILNDDRDDEGVFIGQVGAGLEIRVTPHVGWTNDVSFNLVESGGKHDFLQVRTGVNFAF